ncbi:MAG: LysR family transcriptional regulator [Gammaproteobacteria bacterium]|nr:LysR family transcriptional regulator [Gammaproteobacteria bacterium]
MSRKPSKDAPKLPGTPYGGRVRARLWITGKNGGDLGVGKVQLLEAIAEKGSISQAAKAIGMSYKRAWQLVEELNGLGDSPMVVTETGGAHGGGARLTPRGEQAIRLYRTLEAEFAAFVERFPYPLEL